MNKKTKILFRIPFTLIFLGYVTDGTYIGSYFEFYRKKFNGEYYWDIVG